MSDPLLAWLAAQRESMERWLAAPQANAAHSELQRWWQSVAQTLSPEAQGLAQQLLQLGPGFLAGTGDALFDLFGVRAPAPSGNEGAQADTNNSDGGAFLRWLDLAPIGYFREHQAHAQELGKALEEYRRVWTQMGQSLARIHADALEMLADKIKSMSATKQTIDDTRSLYNAWIECAEQAFAIHARGESFGRLQGELVNSATRVRAAQQTIAEQVLKSLDLPTRPELNSVHKRLKDMRDRIEQLEAALQRAEHR